MSYQERPCFQRLPRAFAYNQYRMTSKTLFCPTHGRVIASTVVAPPEGRAVSLLLKRERSLEGGGIGGCDTDLALGLIEDELTIENNPVACTNRFQRTHPPSRNATTKCFDRFLQKYGVKVRWNLCQRREYTMSV